MHPTKPLFIKQLKLSSWLQTSLALPSLKSTQLKRIAQATGVPTGGPKPELLARLEREILSSAGVHCNGNGSGGANGSANGSGNGKGIGIGKEISILSIDMGIRNLAFAHLTTSTPFSTAAKRKSSSFPKVTLNAWHRLDLTQSQYPPQDNNSNIHPSNGNGNGNGNGEGDDTNPGIKPIIGLPPSPAGSPLREKDIMTNETQGFSLPLYARHAYTLVRMMLDKYQPTHILIERQRFRSIGGSAVQEWSLRVGVFEGMLYSVLETLAREQQRASFGRTSAGAGADATSYGENGGEGLGMMIPLVLGVEPSRVVRYWGDQIGFSNFHLEGREKGQNSVDGKKVKIDIVGGALDRLDPDPDSSADAIPDADVPRGPRDLATHLAIAKDADLHRTIEGYLARWYGKRGKAVQGVRKLGKLDDLADALLQGLTWLEWQVMRERILREGVEFLLNE